jgi:ATP-dependent DNA helicase DinG
MPDYIDTVFGPGGIMSKVFAGYEPRPGQMLLAKAVDEAISCRRHLLAEAPCGVGKSLAYCVPAAWHSAHAGKRVAVVTANIALQEQLHTKDLPMLSGILPWGFKHSLIKGRSNFLCMDRLLDEQSRGIPKGRRTRNERDQYRSVMSWARKTSSGDMSELDFTPLPSVWHLFSSTGDECKGSDCKCFIDCFAEKAHRGAMDADIFVTNYHLLFAHLQVRMATGKDLILPRFDVAVCDEAHKAADIARNFFGFRITGGSVRFAFRLLGRLGMQEEFDDIDDQARVFFDRLRKLYKSGGYKTRFRSPPQLDWKPMAESLRGIGGKFLSRSFGIGDDCRDEKAALRKASGIAMKMAGNLEDAMTLADPDSVYYIEEASGESVALVSKPIHVAPVLAKELFSKTGSVISASATLAVDGGFSHAMRELGVVDPVSLMVDSPFDFTRQAIMVVPDMPEPTDKSFPAAVADAVEKAIILAKGRTLGLFTSYRNLETVWARVSNLSGYRILKQGDKPRTALIEEFRKDVGSVLLGTESFWTGVDVPGEALSCVVIDRLPFQTPDDPVLDAITERNHDWFMSYSVPKAVIAFKQGVGRLIRRSTDKGVIVVLDRRIVTKAYGSRFLASIPAVRKSQKFESIGRFLEG